MLTRQVEKEEGVPLLPGAEPWQAEGGPVGALLVHGFTGSPQSMRPWAEYLAAAGYRVQLPRLPGHGTRWQDLNATRWPDWFAEVERAFRDLTDRCEQVFVLGLSMGGTLAIRLAEVHAGDVAGLVLVNPSLTTEDRRAPLLPLLSRVLSSLPPIGNDIKKPGVREVAYDRLPLKAAASLQQLWRVTRADLAAVVAPLLLFRSSADHVVEPVNGRLLLDGVSSPVREEVVLTDSYHVATLDNDAPAIFAGSEAFLQAHARAGTG